MQKIKALSKKQAFEISATVIISVFAVAAFVFGATTISSSITTGGNLTVSGLSSFGQATSTMLTVSGKTYLSSTLDVTGLATLANATTSLETVTTLWPTNIYGFTLQGAIAGNSQNITALGKLTVTGTTATSTFATGGLTIGTNAFVYDRDTGKLGIGTTTTADQISKHLSSTASLNFGEIATSTCAALTMDVIGAADGDSVVLGVPHALANASSTFTFFGWVSAANTVSVRACQTAATLGGTADPAAATIRADVWKH